MKPAGGKVDAALLDAKLAELLANPINAMSPAGHEEWRTQNAEEIAALLPRVVGSAAVLGYRVDPSSGAIT